MFSLSKQFIKCLCSKLLKNPVTDAGIICLTYSSVILEIYQDMVFFFYISKQCKFGTENKPHMLNNHVVVTAKSYLEKEHKTCFIMFLLLSLQVMVQQLQSGCQHTQSNPALCGHVD